MVVEMLIGVLEMLGLGLLVVEGKLQLLLLVAVRLVGELLVGVLVKMGGKARKFDRCTCKLIGNGRE